MADPETKVTPDDPVEMAKMVITRATVAQRDDTARAMARPTLPATLKMTMRALKRAERAIDQVVRLVPPPRPIACAAGCPWCCHIRLTASIPEVLLVLDYLRRTLSAEELATLTRKVTNVDRITRGRDGATREKQRLPCPLLKDGSCGVHPVRPLSCRAVVSVNVAACRRAYDSHMRDPVPMHEWQYQAANGVGYGLHGGLAQAGFGLEDVEMNAALALGLATPDISKRWLRGEPVFAPAGEVRPAP